MSVYVDPLFTWPDHAYGGPYAAQAKRVGGRNGHQWCHLFADPTDSIKLHTMAHNIGLRREWFHENHYNLTPSKRILAVNMGAVEVTREQAVRIWREQRKGSHRRSKQEQA